MARQFLIPGSVEVQDDVDGRELLVPGQVYVNAEAAAAGGRIWRLAGSGGGLVGAPGALAG